MQAESPITSDGTKTPDEVVTTMPAGLTHTAVAVPDVSSSSIARRPVNDKPEDAATQPPAPIAAPKEEYSFPHLSLLQVFWIFLGIGMRAWGGPVAQIALLKQIIVEEKKWVAPSHFQRAYAVYQVLPGPEAHELCCWAGYLARGRTGSLLAGLGFMLPGFVLMLVFAVLYDTFGIANPVVQEIFSCVQPAVAALVARAVHKIGDHALRDPVSHAFDWKLMFCCVLAAIESVMGVNFFLTLVHCSTVFALCLRPQRWILSVIWTVLPFAAFVTIIAVFGSFSALVPKAIGAGSSSNLPGATFLVGLEGGLLTFGGAYTAIPIMENEVVTLGHWLTTQQFLDGIAIGQVLPSPLVIFTTFVGYLAHHWVGAVLMTLGMFLPAFSFTLIGHNLFERVVASKGVVMHVLDGVSATVIGLILLTAVQLTFSVVRRPIDAIIFGMAGFILIQLKSKFTPIFVVGLAAFAGAAFYMHDQ